MLNINQSDDPFYRYKMNKIRISKGGKGNGCFTNLLNLNEISKDLSHPEEIIFKFISNNLGTNGNFDKKRINGHYSDKEIQNVIFDYINTFVVCSKCSVPELIPEIEGKKKKKKLISHCSACGTINDYGIKYLKTNEQIIKFLEKNNWDIVKGNIVTANDFNPFDNFIDDGIDI